MDSETKTCQNCQNQFVIEPEDFEFYAKIQVPPPTFCPDCRLQRRLAWRNERTLYKRKCDATDETIFSMFASNTKIKVYKDKYWWTDDWDPMVYGKNYDYDNPFFKQLKKLIIDVPWGHNSLKDAINSDYCNNATGLKNCYLVFYANYNEDCAYGIGSNYSKDCFDFAYLNKSELCYDSFYLINCYKTFFASNCESCHNVYFSKNCINCNDCFGCVNLRNKQYYIFNKPYNKDEYFKKIKEFNLGSYNNFLIFLNKASKFWLEFPRKYMYGRHNSETTGDYIFNSKNIHTSFLIFDEAEDSKFCQFLTLKPIKDCYDYSIWGNNAKLVYESVACGIGISNLKFNFLCWPNCYNVHYSLNCHSCHDIFGCIGLRDKSYCILNKQYTKESFDKLRTKIIEHMNAMPYISKIQKSNLKNQNDKFSAQGGSAPGGKITKSQPREIVYRYGEFFPPELSPFSYNETVAQEYFPLTREEVISKGYSWKEPEERNYQIDIKAEELPDHIKDVKDDILAQIIECGHKGQCNEQCTKAFKIIPQELEFYRKMNLSLPRLCPNCRHYQRIKQRNPLKLWHRKCQCAGKTSDPQPATGYQYQNTIEHPHHKQDHCPNEFETSYAPERPEIVYCEQCYLTEVV